MNNTGSPESIQEKAEGDFASAEEASRPVPLKWIVLAAVVLAFACFVGVQLFGVLYPIVSPPAPPLPEGVVEVSHTSSDYGVDEWLYTTTEPACRIVQFYVDEGAKCLFAPDCDTAVGPGLSSDSQSAARNVNRCVADEKVSIFAMRWQVVVGVSANMLTEFRLQREVYWTGSVPPYQQPELSGLP